MAAGFSFACQIRMLGVLFACSRPFLTSPRRERAKDTKVMIIKKSEGSYKQMGQGRPSTRDGAVGLERCSTSPQPSSESYKIFF